MSALPASPLRRSVSALVVTVAVGIWVAAMVISSLDGAATRAITGLGAVGFATVGGLLIRQRPTHALGPVLAVGGIAVLLLGGGGVYARHALVTAPGSLPAGTFVAWFADSLALICVGTFGGLVPQLFPTGRLPGRRWRWSLLATILFMVFGVLGNALHRQDLETVAGMVNPYAPTPLQPLTDVLLVLAVPCGAVMLLGSLTALVARWRSGQAEQRQQLRWFLTGMLLLPPGLVVHDQVDPRAGSIAVSFALCTMAVGLGVAVMKYRLYDLDLVVRRAVGYALVSTVVAGLYLVLVGGAQALVGEDGVGSQVFAAVVAAAAFQPLRGRVQRRVDRVFYGDRARPYDAVNQLSRNLEGALLPESVLPAVAATVAESLRLPYVCLEVLEGSVWKVAAEIGAPLGEPVPFAMAYQGKTVGRLLVSPRSKEDRLSPEDTRLLTDLARQAGVAAQAVATDAALRRSRADLVAAREEERRRIRRDLHDGLGPTLAGVTLGLHAARVQVSRDPAAAQDQLDNLERQIADAILDVRRLVYDLRPPALDEFGLVRAVQMHAARLEGEVLSLSVDAPEEGLGRLPAAVEVAAYRIATEALTNVTRHARAGHGVVRFRLNGGLEVEIEDDGCGIADGQPAGVGLTAMRERAAELGGQLTVASSRRGTTVSAHLPVPS